LAIVENLLPSTTIGDDSLWGIVVSTEEASLFLVKSKLFLYHHLLVSENHV
jgi:hypothetical protein